MPLVQTRGAASAQGFGEFAQVTAVNYIEDVFSTYLYTGSNSSQTITNGIDLSTNGGLVWTKVRTTTYNHCLTDTIRGGNKQLFSNTTDPSTTSSPAEISSFNTTGYTLAGGTVENNAGQNFVGWTFRKQPKFFDVVTYTGTGSNTTIAHSLGSVPGSIIVKRTDTTAAWAVYHRSLANTQYLVLNTTAAVATGATWWNSTTPTSSVFSVGTDASVNASGGTYVAYLFAHDAGGFGLAGTDNVISCGSFTADGAGFASVTLGYEPQWILFKNATFAGSFWTIQDVMRGMPDDRNVPSSKRLFPNNSNVESDYGAVSPTSTGFISGGHGSGDNIIYIAIRRGPMKVPTLGTSVFSPNYQNVSTGTAITTNFPPDLQLYRSTAQVANEGVVVDRLRGVNTTTTANSTPWLDTTTTAAEATASNVTRNWGNTGFEMPGFVATVPTVFYSYRRAPSFFDEVCYTGTGSAATLSHNLAAVPDLIIIKNRGAGATNWAVNVRSINTDNWVLNLEETAARFNNALFSAAPTSTTMTFTGAQVNAASNTYVAYLFATCAGVSKVGSYTGTATTLQIDCGFTAGARFVLIKRTDSTGDWYVWDSARGIVSGNDPYLLLNTTAAEVTSTDYVDTYSAGFEISSTAPAAINASAGSFIFLAIA